MLGSNFVCFSSLIIASISRITAASIESIARFIAKYGNGDNSVLQEIKEFLEQQKNEDQEHAMGSKEATVILEIEAIINEVNQAKLDPSNSVDDAVQITVPVLSERVANALGYNSEKLNKMSFSRNISNTVRRLGLMKNRRTIGKGITAFNCTSALIKEAKQRYKIETTLSNPSNPSNLTNLNESNLTPSGNPHNAESSDAWVIWDTWLRPKPTEKEEKRNDILTPIDEEVALIAYREKTLPMIRVKEKWHNFDSPSIDKLRNSAAKLATTDYPLLRFQNDVIEWIGDRWSE